ncbi:RTA1 like protein-domain-containing protein [Mycena sp. CBHHK59/15]|nr:RTA1 like protein-domain-containing protein [Mycena sp. CBHHK59/15]
MATMISVKLRLCCAAPQLECNEDNKRPSAGFIPKKLPTFIALALFGISTFIHWTQFFAIGRKPFMLTLTIGMTAMVFGFVLRLVYATSPYSLIRYILMDMFILLSPCAFLATDYMLLARLTATFDDKVTDRCLLVRSSRIVKFFVWSDCITFFLQASGGGLSSQHSVSMANLGSKITMIGLGLQAASFSVFTVVLLVFGRRVSTHFPAAWQPQELRPFRVLSRAPVQDWRILFYTLCFTCIGILVRSVFRIVEFAGGYHGMVARHEGYFYFFDALPLWLSMSLFCVVWPVRFLNVRPGQMELLASGKAYA